MGMIGQYIDSLPARARDRLIEAQDWCIAGVIGDGGRRCLVGHAEDWHPLARDEGRWRRWMDGETGDLALAGAGSDVETLCSPALFAFRRARPADLPVYRSRLRRWGIDSENRIGARFDRLCARRGQAEALRLVKSRAAAGDEPGGGARPAAPPTAGETELAAVR